MGAPAGVQFQAPVGGKPMTQSGLVSFARHIVRRPDPASRHGWTLRAASLAFTLAAFLGAAPANAQNAGSVSGTVVVEGAQRPLPGAQISIEGQTDKNTVTDASGRFRITGLTGTNVTVSVRALGFRPASQPVAVGTQNMRFVLSERAVELNQVVVTGTAGGEQLRSIGTSVATVNVADVAAKTSIPSVDALLNGRTPGVVVLPGTGQIGAGANIRVRGIGTFSLSSQPLVYVDGVRVNNQTGTGNAVQAFSSGVVSRLNDFDPSEIENIEVLKGPAAATLYGTEAARGVINIITKRGTTGSTKYSFQVQGGSNWFQNAEGRIPTNYCVQPTPTTCVNSNAVAGPLLGLNVVTQENARGQPLFRTGDIRNYAANVSGGTPTIRFFASGELAKTEGAERTNLRDQKAVRTNLNITPNSKVDISTSVGYIYSHTQLSCEAGCGGTMWESMYSNPVNLPQFCDAGNVGCTYVRGFQSTPPIAFNMFYEAQNLNRLTASTTLQYRPFSWMTHRLAIGTDFNLEDNPESLPYMTNDTAAFFWGDYSKGYRWHNQHQATYNTYDYTGSVNFNPTSTLSSKTSLGAQYYTRKDAFIQGEGDFFPAPGLQTIGSAGTKIALSDGWSGNNTLGYYLQEQLGWKDRLYLTGAARVDNNSSFGKDVKWVGYPKASLSYVASEEPSIRSMLPSAINSLRLRGAFGASGQQPALNTALQTLSPVAGPNGQGILTPNTLGNADLKPERVEGLELGFESGMFNDRVGIDFTYFRDVSKDAILSRGVAPSSGFGVNNQFFNAGQITKQGIELGLKGQILNARDYAWDFGFTLGTHTSKINRLNGADTTIDGGSYSHRVGYAPFDWFSYKVLSADWDPTKRRAVNAMCDNGRGQPTPCLSATGGVIAPKVYLGHGIPSTEGAFTTTFRFLRNFSVYAMADYATGYKRLDNNLRIRCQIFYTCAEYLEPEKTDPRKLAQMQTSGTLRDFVINDSKFMKLREVSLSYEAPSGIAARAGAKQAGFTVAARNLHTWTPYTGLDPESEFVSGGTVNVDQAHVPQLMSLVLTIRLSY
jgi:TonB-linked SusC/RagA family outer membrane protein